MSIIKPMQVIATRLNPVTGKQEPPKAPKKYLLLIYFMEEKDGNDKTFEIITGRDETFKWLFENKDTIDLTQSHVMTQIHNLEQAITAYTFMRICLENHMSEYDKEDIDFDEDDLAEYMLTNYDMAKTELEEIYEEIYKEDAEG
jgi:hypothetical protein